MTEKPQGDINNPKSVYLNDLLSNHIGHKLEIVEYYCGICEKTTDFMLRCFQDEIDDTCSNDPSGIAREWILPECNCHELTAIEKAERLRKNLTGNSQAE